METFPTNSARNYTPLPIDNQRGFPQSFPFLFAGQTYHFWLYVNIAADLLVQQPNFLELPQTRAFLAVRVEREIGGNERQTIFQRKVLPSLEYEAENIVLAFPQQRIARNNLNGQGDFGSQVTGGIATRWA